MKKEAIDACLSDAPLAPESPNACFRFLPPGATFVACRPRLGSGCSGAPLLLLSPACCDGGAVAF